MVHAAGGGGSRDRDPGFARLGLSGSRQRKTERTRRRPANTDGFELRQEVREMKSERLSRKHLIRIGSLLMILSLAGVSSFADDAKDKQKKQAKVLEMKDK